ncbi:DNA topoisomerase [Burkholderia pseudomallei]|uniref:DNA topoisomerase n=1 Tax=Burkholderia pseudomallei TaxID=28450 RepID=UPI000537CDE1|nr:DNA topoisomerase [Burkholderia pseudomallei]KGX18548.1 DNA topoisomerase family protein [Burkholderia pseudomallei ABCPW 1]
MGRLFIAEKPSLAEAVWSVLPGTPERNGMATRVGDDWFVPLAGHILEQATPDAYLPDDVPRTKSGAKQWRAQDLPIVPTQWLMQPRASGDNADEIERDRKNNEAKLAKITTLLKQVDQVVHLGDPDEEGQLLVDEVLLYLGNSKPVMRLLVNDYNATKVREALSNLRSNDEPTFRGWFTWALTRSRYDWLFGLNCTRAATIRARELGYDGTLSVGRVQTAALRLVYERDRQIESFRPIPYFSLSATFQHAGGSFQARWKAHDDQPGLDAAGRLIDVQQATALVARVRGAAAVIDAYEKKERRERPPLPMSLNELTIAACTRFGCTAEDVLEAAQALYEKYKVTSYPRTEIRYLSEAQLDAAPQVMNAIRCNVAQMAALIERADLGASASLAFDDKKMEGAEHHAIVPTIGVADLSSATDLQRGIYDMVVRSYLAQFFPDATFLQTKIDVVCAQEMFVATGKTPLTAGWREVYAPPEDPVQSTADNDQDDDKQTLPPMVQGDGVQCVTCDAASRETKPPTRFDEASLIAAMVDLHKYTTDEAAKKRLKEGKGIGTSATRARIIKELRARKLLGPFKDSKTRLMSTQAGRALIEALPPAVSDPTMAGQFQVALDAVATGGLTYDSFMATSKQFVAKVVTDLLVARMKLPLAASVPCPKCKTGQLRLRKSDKGPFWGCTNWQAEPKCDARYSDANGKPNFQATSKGKGFGFKKMG